MTVTHRKCTKCGEEKPLEDFSPHAKGKYGRQPRCKRCCVEANSTRYYANLEASRERSRLAAIEAQRRDPERRNAQRRAWAQRNPEKDTASKAAWNEANKDRKRAANEAWRKANLERFNEAGKAWKKANPAAMKKYRLRKYGLTIEQYEAMVAAQDGRCAICDTTTPAKHGQWCIDHDHGTHDVRGLLCVKCNAGLGSFDDNPAFLLSAERYLQRHVSRRRLRVVDG